MLKVDWDRLRIFAEVALIGNFSHASQILHVSQSALSRQISLLEKEIGYPLFVRVPRGLVLTPQGEILSKVLQETRAQLASTEMILKGHQEIPQETLKIAVTDSLCSNWFYHHLSLFSCLYPSIHFQVFEKEYKEMDVDISLSVFPLEKEKVYHFSCKMGLYAHKNYVPFVLKKVEDTKDYLFIGHETYSESSDLLKVYPDILVKNTIKTLKLNSWTAIYTLLKHAKGIGYLPENFVNPQDDLFNILPFLEKPHLIWYLCCHSFERKCSSLFYDFLIQPLQSLVENNGSFIKE